MYPASCSTPKSARPLSLHLPSLIQILPLPLPRAPPPVSPAKPPWHAVSPSRNVSAGSIATCCGPSPSRLHPTLAHRNPLTRRPNARRQRLVTPLRTPTTSARKLPLQPKMHTARSATRRSPISSHVLYARTVAAKLSRCPSSLASRTFMTRRTEMCRT